MKTTHMSKDQKKALLLFREAVEFKKEAKKYAEKFETQWVGEGNIPNFEHFKRLCLGKDKIESKEDIEFAIKIANMGYLDAKLKYKVRLYFTQSLLYGATVFGMYEKFRVIFPSQYGKSFVTGLIVTSVAERGEPVNVVCDTVSLTETIMKSVWDALQTARIQIKDKLIATGLDKIEKGQISLSKDNIGFRGGGIIRAISVGGSKKDALSGNNALGKDGNYFIDESAKMEDEPYAETGRSEYGVNKLGGKYISYEISNPHNTNHFYRDVNVEDVRPNTMIVWGDIRIPIEEGRLSWDEDEFIDTTFFKDASKVKSYLLCEFDNGSDGQFFTTELLEDNSPIDDKNSIFFMGLDPAEKGSDRFNAHIIEYKKNGTLRSFKTEDLKPKGEWVDGKTPDEILDNVLNLILLYNIRAVAVDRGYGQHLINGLAKRERSMGFTLISVVYNERPTKELVEANFSSAKNADRKRDELHIAVKELLDEGKLYATTDVKNVLQPQLNSIHKASRTMGGKISIESKKNVRKRIDRSPDDLDGLLLAVHAWLLFITDYSNVRFYS